MPLIKDNHVVETLTSNGADHPFDEWILPRGARCGKDLLYPETVDATIEVRSVGLVSVPYQVPRRRVPWKSIDHLLRRPLGGRMLGDIEMNDTATVVAKDDEDEQNSEGCGRQSEKVERVLSKKTNELKTGAPGRLRLDVSTFGSPMEARILDDIIHKTPVASSGRIGSKHAIMAGLDRAINAGLTFCGAQLQCSSDERCILAACVAPPSNAGGILGRRALPAVLVLFTVGDMYVSLCKIGAYAPFSVQRRSRALFWL